MNMLAKHSNSTFASVTKVAGTFQSPQIHRDRYINIQIMIHIRPAKESTRLIRSAKKQLVPYLISLADGEQHGYGIVQERRCCKNAGGLIETLDVFLEEFVLLIFGKKVLTHMYIE